MPSIILTDIRRNPEYAVKALMAAAEAGADRLVRCRN